jgi:hypothetical protein
MSINYFAFGSNLSSQRLLQRLPAAVLADVAILRHHRLCFRNNARGASGKCDIEFTDNQDDNVYGIIYLLTEAEKLVLDGYETAGFGYLDKPVEVFTADGKTIEAITYYAATSDGMHPPYHWYKQHVLRGALEHSFPAEYIAAIEAVHSIEDPSPEQASNELAIYCDNQD